jgi:hypothetical protein
MTGGGSVSAPVVLEPVELDRVLADHDAGVLVLFDLDVDDVNKKYGRAAGDRVLAAFDEMLQKASLVPGSGSPPGSGRGERALVE